MSHMKNKAVLILVVLFGSFQIVTSQNLLEILDEEQKDTTGYITPSFKMSRIALGHSTEVRGQNILEVFTASRFWNLPGERSQSFGADKMSTRIALEYGLTDRLNIGFGGTTFDGLFDGFVKYKLFSQKKGEQSFPFNITILQGASYNSSTLESNYLNRLGSNRFAFTSQVLISRKVTSDFSIQLSPTFIHKSFGLSPEDDINFMSLGIGARYKVGPHVSIVSEYYNTFNKVNSFDTYGPFAIGVNWELGDVLLQFMLTNARNMVEDTFITQTVNNFNFKDPNLNFGFNATYVIHFSNKLKRKK